LWALANVEREAITTILTRWFANSCNKQISYHFLVMHIKAAYPNYNLCNKLSFQDFRRLVTPGSMIQTRKTTIVTDILDNVHYLWQKNLQHFGKWICLCLRQSREREEPPLVGPLETASQIPGPGLAFSNGPTTAEFSLVRFHLNTMSDPASHILWVFCLR